MRRRGGEIRKECIGFSRRVVEKVTRRERALFPVHIREVIERDFHPLGSARGFLILETARDAERREIVVRLSRCRSNTEIVGALRSDDTVPVNDDLVPLGFAPEDGVVVENQNAAVRLKTTEMMRRGEPGEPAAHDNEVVALTRIRAIDRLVESPCSHLMRNAQDFRRVAM